MSNNDHTLPESAETNEDYPTRCPNCNRPVERLSVFPKGRCIDCHAFIVNRQPMPTAGEIVNMWKGGKR